MVLLARLHETLDVLLGLDLADVPEGDLPGLVTGLVEVGHRVAAAQLDAVGAFDAAGLAGLGPERTTRRWLEARTRLSAGQAAGLVSTARAVRDHLPGTRDALAAGQISAAHAGVISGVVRAVGVEHAQAAEPILLRLAREAEPSVVRRATAELLAVLDPAAAEQALHRDYQRRCVTLAVAGGRGYLHGVLDLESTETLAAALGALMAPAGPGDARDAGQRRADALVDLARRALDGGDLPGTGGERPHLSVVVDADTLGSGRGAVTLPVGVGRRWACEAALTAVLARVLPSGGLGALPGVATASGDGGSGGTGWDGGGLVLGPGWLPLAVGRASRTVTPAQVKALRVRDGGCVHPGCTRSTAFCDAHHVVAWADGGPTDLANLVLLCRHHHRTLHAGGWGLDPDPHQPGRFRVTPARGPTRPAQTATDRSPPLRPTA